MTLLVGVLSSRRRVIARTGAGTQDTGGLNATSPLGDELLWAVVSGAHPRRDRVGAYDGQGEGSAQLATDAAGFTALHSPGWGGNAWFWPTTGIALGTAYTVAMRLRLESPTEEDLEGKDDDFPKLLTIPYRDEATWLMPFGWSFALLPLGTGATSARIRFISPLNATQRNRATSPSAFVLLDGAEHTYTVRVRSDGDVDWWRDGAAVATTTWQDFAHAAPDLGDAPMLIAFAEHRRLLEEGTRATMPAAAIWGKALSDQQIADFHTNPWDLAEVSTALSVPARLHAWDDYVVLPRGATTTIHPLANDSGEDILIDSVTQPQGVAAGTHVAIVGGGDPRDGDMPEHLAGVIFALDPMRSETTIDGGVAQIDDLGPGGKHFVQDDPNFRLALEATGILDAPALRGQSDGYLRREEALLWPQGDFALYLLVRGPAQSANRFYSEGNSASATPTWHVGSNSAGKLRLQARNDSGTMFADATSNATVFDDQPHVVCVSRSGGTGQIWIDGALDTTFTASGTITLHRTGLMARLRPSADLLYDGRLGPVFAYSEARNANQAAQVEGYLAAYGEPGEPPDPPPASPYFEAVTGIPDLLAYWRLGEAGGDAVSDHSGNGHHGTVIGAVVRGADPLPEDTADDATLFEGAGHVVVPHSAAFALPAVTVSGWFTVTALPGTGFQPIFGKDASGNSAGDFAAWIEPSGVFSVHVQTGSANHVISFPPVTLGQTYHWLAILDGTGLQAWLNNSPGTPQTGFTGAWQSNQVELRLGGVHWTANRHQGVLDEVAIYARALNVSERELLSQREEVLPDPPTVPPPPSGEDCVVTAGLTVVNVSSASALQSALNNASPGTLIRVANGTYNGTFTAPVNATAGSPIVVMAVNPHQAIFTGLFDFRGRHTILLRVRFSGGSVRFSVGARNNRVCASRIFDSSTHAIDNRAGAHDNIVDYNEFRFYTRAGIFARNEKDVFSTGLVVRRNYFHSPRPSGSHTPEFTSHVNVWAQTGYLIEYNLIDGYDDPTLTGNDETLSLKSGGNIIRGNTMRNRNSQNFKNRMSVGNIWEWNHCRWMVLHGDDLIVRQNIVTNELWVGSGNCYTDGEVHVDGRAPLRPQNHSNHGLPACRDALIEDNAVSNRVRVGHAHSNFDFVPALRTTVRRTSGNITLHRQENTTIIGGAPNMPSHVKALTAADVGPDAYHAECG